VYGSGGAAPVTNYGGTVSVIDPTTLAVAQPPSFDTYYYPGGVAVAPAGTPNAGDAYVSYMNWYNNSMPSVAVYNPATHHVDTVIPVGPLPSSQAQLGEVAVSPITGDVYVTTGLGDSLTVISYS
jgi:DNA-binding beta-propeller fold protein YncE